MGTGHDILTSGKPPRAVFIDYPLGNTCGRPFAPKEQYDITRAAVEALAEITEPGTMLTQDYVWSEDESWKAKAIPDDMVDRRQPRDFTPHYQFEEDRIAAEGRGA